MTEAQAAARKRYNASEKGRASRARYVASEKGRAAQRRAKARYNAENADTIRQESRRRKQAIRARIDAYKLEQRCTDCGYATDAVALDFDHAGSDKVANVSALIDNASLAAVLAEIEKCDVVCANCHRIRTRNERRAGK